MNDPHSQSLYLLYEGSCPNHKERLELLSVAARLLEVSPVLIDSEKFDYSSWTETESGPRNMFYNVTPYSHELENIFIHKGLTGFFVEPHNTNYVMSSTQLDVALINAGIPVPRTVVQGTNDRELLKKYVEYIDGFPLIIKVFGGNVGVGVMLVDSWKGLVSLTDYLVSTNTQFVIKQFIPNEGTIRAIVVGDKLVCTVMRGNQPEEFRCSSPLLDPKIFFYEAPEELKDVALLASKACKYEFVGLDIIQDEAGKFWVLEANYPQNFVPPQKFSGIDIALEAVRHLKNKAARGLENPTN